MSAGAIILDEKTICLASDGIRSQRENGELQPKLFDSNKIWKVSDRTALIWLGAWNEVMFDDFASRIKTDEPAALADLVPHVTAWYDFEEGIRVMITGFDPSPVIYQVTDDGIKKHPQGSGVYVWSMFYGSDHSEKFMELFDQHVGGYTLPRLMKKTFREAVDHYKGQTAIVGGELFYLTLKKAS
jgi:hypothetical protein